MAVLALYFATCLHVMLGLSSIGPSSLETANASTRLCSAGDGDAAWAAPASRTPPPPLHRDRFHPPPNPHASPAILPRRLDDAHPMATPSPAPAFRARSRDPSPPSDHHQYQHPHQHYKNSPQHLPPVAPRGHHPGAGAGQVRRPNFLPGLVTTTEFGRCLGREYANTLSQASVATPLESRWPFVKGVFESEVLFVG